MRRQRGVTLILAIALLVVLTMVMLTSLQITYGQEKIGFNQRDMQTAFHAAEAALREGELWVREQTAVPSAVSVCASTPCDVWENGAITPGTSDGTWWATNGRAFTGAIELVSSTPQFVVQEVMTVPFELSPESLANDEGYHYYRITARGVGKEDNTIVILESIFATEFK